MTDNPPKNVLLRLPPLMAGAIDQAAMELGQTRSSFIRESVGKRLAFYQEHEREIILFLRRQAASCYATPSAAMGDE